MSGKLHPIIVRLAVVALALCCLLTLCTFAGQPFGMRALAASNVADGSKIESVEIHWITEDDTKVNEGDEVYDNPTRESEDVKHLFLSPVSNKPISMRYQLEVSFSGQYDYKPGDIIIYLPAQVWKDRDGNPIGKLSLPVPKAPSNKGDFEWKLVDDKIVLTNTQTIGATSKQMFQVSITDLVPSTIKDMSECAEISALVRVHTNQNHWIELETDKDDVLTAQINTYEYIQGTDKRGVLYETRPAGLPDTLLKNLPGAPEDYLFVRWMTHVEHTGNQPYTLSYTDTLGGAYEVETVTDENGKNPVVVKKEKKHDGIFLGCTTGNGKIVTGKAWNYEETVVDGAYHDDKANAIAYDQTRYMWSAYPKSAFPAPEDGKQVDYRMYNTVEWTLEELDEKVDDPGRDKLPDAKKKTTAKKEAAVRYSPVQWSEPGVGVISMNKWTQRRFLKNYDYGYGLNRLRNNMNADMRFVIRTSTMGYPYTKVAGQGIADEDAYGRAGWMQITEDYNTFFNSMNNPLKHEDFEFRGIIVGIPARYRYGKGNDGNWDYISDPTLPTPDMLVQYQLNGEDTWYDAATATWGDGGLGTFRFEKVQPGIRTDGMTVFFPSSEQEGVTDTVTNVRTIYVSNVFHDQRAESCEIAGIEWYTYPLISLKPSPYIKSLVELLFYDFDAPKALFKNDARTEVYGYCTRENPNGVLVAQAHDYSRATISGAVYGVSIVKSSTYDPRDKADGGDNDVLNKRIAIHYTAKVDELSNLTTAEDYQDAVKGGAIAPETSCVWYDLLPEGVAPLKETVRMREGDEVRNVIIRANYKNSGRILMIVEADLSPDPVYTADGYVDSPELSFTAVYTWDDMSDIGKTLVNYIAFESTSDLILDTLGTRKGQQGEPDSPRGLGDGRYMNTKTPGVVPDELVDIFTNLDPTNEDSRFLYARDDIHLDVDVAAGSELKKRVRNDLVGVWSQGLEDQEQVTVYEGQRYTYSLRAVPLGNSKVKDIVIYDTLENYIIPRPGGEEADATKAKDYEDRESKKDWKGDWKASDNWPGGQWRGTLVSVDLRRFLSAGVKPVLYYSTVPNLQFGDTEKDWDDDRKQQFFNEGTYVIPDARLNETENAYWHVAELDATGNWFVPEELKGQISAIAIDAR